MKKSDNFVKHFVVWSCRKNSEMTVDVKMETNEGEATSTEIPMETEEKEAAKETVTFTLEVLQLIKEQHAQHGLRHGDYQR